jgi:Ribonucleases P/MRP protein subunit POP1
MPNSTAAATATSSLDGTSSRNRKRRRDSSDGRRSLGRPGASSFLDATGAVSVSTFGSRRLPELERLYSEVVDNKRKTTVATDVLRPYLSGGGKTSSRHLRRRTTSVRTRKHFHRYPQLRDGGEDNQQEKSPPTWQGISRKSKRKKQSQLKGQHLLWLRRRRRRQQEQLSSQSQSNTMETMKSEPTNNDDDWKSDSVVVHWLTTHLWHTKRCHIHNNLWGWNIPMMHTNRGPRAALRLSKSGTIHCLLRDVSWENQPVMYIQVRCLSSSMAREQGKFSNDSTTDPSVLMVQHLLQNLGRISPHLVSSSLQSDKRRMASFVHGYCMLDCFMYQLDQFPNLGIGPVSWRILNVPKASSTVIEVRCHPSLQSSVTHCLKDLIDAANTTVVSESLMGSFEWIQVDDDSTALGLHEAKICFRLYGTIANRILNEISDLEMIDDHDTATPQLREQSSRALEFIRRAAVENNSSKEKTNVETVSENLLYHGMIIRAKLTIKNPQTTHQPSYNTCIVDDDDDESKQEDDKKSSSSQPSSMSSHVMLVYRSPRPLDCEVNRAMSGWDIYCCGGDSSDDGTSNAKVEDGFVHWLWMKLVLKNCCVIGMVEDVHLKLECEPPIPIFPRDAVDTLSSHHYWVGGTSFAAQTPDDGKKSKSLDDWSMIRHLLEDGWGRVRMHVTPSRAEFQQRVDFQRLVGLDDRRTVLNEHEQSEDDVDVTGNVPFTQKDPIVVRGDFLIPFLEALNSCGRLPRNSSQAEDPVKAAPTHRRHRKHRKGSCEKACVNAEKLSKQERESAAAQCNHLLSSLSLPAVLLVHIRSIGKGTIDPGMSIYSCSRGGHKSRSGGNDDDDNKSDGHGEGGDYCSQLLGRITAGSFSPSRGVCHGIGIISAARLLNILSSCNHLTPAGMVVRVLNGTKSLQLAVMVGKKTSTDCKGSLHPACLSLIATV